MVKMYIKEIVDKLYKEIYDVKKEIDKIEYKDNTKLTINLVEDICFSCKKCNHHLYCDIGSVPLECPNCGEEPHENWIFVGYGNLGDFE